MDQKTLEYMAERVDKARNIQKRIKELEHFISYSNDKTSILILDRIGNGPQIKRDDYPRLASKAKALVIEAIQEEIKLLNQELAEL